MIAGTGPGAGAGGRIPPALRRAAFPGAMAAVLALQVAAVCYFEPPDVVMGPEPALGGDLAIHAYEARCVATAVDRWGRTWAWDPSKLAGYPCGTVYDSDNKGLEAWTYCLRRLGIPFGLAFNTYLILAHLLLPWVVFASARLLRLDRWSALLAAGLGLLVWYFDGPVHWCWYSGTVSYAMAAYLVVLPVALFHRWIEDRRTWQVLLLAVIMAIVHMVHPFSFVSLVLPMAVIYVAAARKLRPRDHLAVLGVAIATIAANAWWLTVAFHFRHQMLDSGQFGAPSPAQFLYDWLGLTVDRRFTGGAGMRTGFRFLALGAAAITLAHWRRERDSRFLPLAVGIAAMIAVAYLGGLAWILRQIQPYRHIAPAVFLCLIPAAALPGELARRAGKAPAPSWIVAALALAALVALPRLARDVLYFTPALLPGPAAATDGPAPGFSDPAWFGDIGYPVHKEFRRHRIPDDMEDVARWLDSHHDGRGRVLVESPPLAEYLGWRSGAQVIGGKPWVNMVQSDANPFRRMLDGRSVDLGGFLRQYAVGLVVLTYPSRLAAGMKGMIEPEADLGPHAICRSKLPVDWFAEGSGRVEASLNRISISGSPPGEDLVLKFHWIDTFACEPGCSIEMEPVHGDRAGFVRVKAPHPATFDIVNAY